jgi:hypothetical protein
MNDFINIFQIDNLSTKQLDYYTYNALKSLNLVYPPYNKLSLANVSNTYHEQALIFKSNVVKGYYFEDETKAEKIKKFLDEGIYNQFEVNISFMEYLQMQLYNEAIYFAFYDQIGFFAGEATKLYPLSPKYLYCNRKKDKFYQIMPDADKTFDINEPGTDENNTNYEDNATRFDNFALKTSGARQAVFEYSGLGSNSDYYPNITYLEALEQIKTNRLIGKYDQKWLENGTVFKNILELSGIDSTSPIGEKIVDKYKRDLNSVSRNGEIYIITNPTGDLPIKFLNPTQAQKENFNETRDLNRDEILASHGLNPTLLGIKTNESSLTSTSQGESIKMYIETQLGNKITRLEKHYNKLFKKIDPAFDTSIKFKPLSFEDAIQQVQVETQEILNEKELILRGDLEEFNAYRIKRSKKTLEPDAFNKMSLELKTGGFLTSGNQGI